MDRFSKPLTAPKQVENGKKKFGGDTIKIGSTSKICDLNMAITSLLM